MTVEDRLRESLERQAAQARPSDAAWNTITDRLSDRGREPRRWLIPALAMGTAAALVTVTVAVMGQGEDSSGIKAAAPAPTTTLVRQSLEDVVPISAVFPGIWPENTWDEYDAAMASFTATPQPWRADPVEVATAYLNEKGFEAPRVADYEEFPEDPTCGHVRYTLAGGDEAEGNFVEVCRLEEDSAALVVTAAWTDRFSYGEPLYESPMEFSIGIAVPGSLDVRAGAFNSEWIDELTIDVTADEIEGPGYQVPASLDLGPGDALPKSLLVQIFHRPAGDGVMALTEFRLDLAEDSPQARFPDSPPSSKPEAIRSQWTIPRK